MFKWQKLMQEAADAAKAARAIHQKAADESRDMTEAERADYQKSLDLATTKHAEAEQAKAEQASRDKLEGIIGDGEKAGQPGSGTRVEVGASYESFGERFVKSEPYVAFKEDHPTGIGAGSPVSIGRVKVGSLGDYYAQRKTAADALVSGDMHIQNVRMPMVDQTVQYPLTILDLIDRGQCSGNFEYLQVTSINDHAARVPEATGSADDGALKPKSDLGTELADAKVYTYADGYDVTNQLLSDVPGFSAFMNNKISYCLDSVIEDSLLNADGQSGAPKGLFHTTGVQNQSYALGSGAISIVEAVRKAITKVTRVGGAVTGIVLNPEDDEAIDLLKDKQDRYLGQGPFSTGPGTLWGRPRSTSEKIAAGTVALGDWKQMALLDREGLAILAFNQHKDYAQRNLTYVRAELRAAQVIWMPARFCVVTPNGAIVPVILSVTADTAATAGGSLHYIGGYGFTGTTGVTVGGTAATAFQVISDSVIAIIAPAKTAGAKAIVVTNATGASTDVLNLTYS